MLQIVLFIAVIGAVLLYFALQKRFSRVRNVAQGLIISYVMVLLILGGAEFYLRYIYADSHLEFALTKDNWKNRYVIHNSLGYRDREWTVDELENRTTVFIVGDSFTEGHGIDNPADRYTDALARNLGDDYAIVNLGKGGTSTIHQIEALQNYPFQQPDIIIWQYFLNDIDVAAKSNGMPWEYEAPEVPWIANQSYLASFVFWRLNESKLFVNKVDGLSEWDYMFAAYDNAPIWEIHKAEIKRMIDQVNSMEAKLIVLIYPEMIDPFRSLPYVDRVEQAMREYGVTDILKLTDAAAAWPLEERIVSPRDNHASAAFSTMVGETLYNQFFETSNP